MKQDLIYSFRTLSRSPGFSAAAILTLGLGIGANTSIFSAIQGILLRPLPRVLEPDGLVTPLHTSIAGTWNSHSYPDLLDYRERNRVFSGIIGYSMIHVALGDRAEADHVWGEMVTANYFDVLGVRPAVGRGFLPEEDRGPGAHPVVVLGHSLWKRHFGGDPEVVGRTVHLNGHPFAVVGVAAEGFSGTNWPVASDVWVPVMMHAQIDPGFETRLEERGSHWMKLLARLAPGVTLREADADLRRIAEELAETFPANRGSSGSVVGAREGRFPAEAVTFISLGATLALIVAGLVLLIACANVANLLLARASAGSRDIGIRLAVGASRGRLVRQLLGESLLLALAGGACALVLTLWGSDLLLRFHPPLEFDVVIDYQPDRTVFLYATGLCLLTTLVFGLAPALKASSVDLLSSLRGEEVLGRGRSRLGGTLVVAQLALSLVVLAAAGLFLRSLAEAQKLDPGFRKENVLLVRYDLGLLGYSEEEGRRFHRELLEKLRAVAGVAAAGLSSDMPLDYDWSSSGPVIAEGKEPPPEGEGLSTLVNCVSPGHVEAMGVPLLAGRDFAFYDTADHPAVAIVNETFARLAFPGEGAVGKRFRLGGPEAPLREVVGVARDGKYYTLSEAPRAYLYLPMDQAYRSAVTLQVRTKANPLSVVDAVRKTVRGMDGRLPLYGVRPLDEHMEFALWWTRMGAVLAGVFGGLGLTLAAVGLFGLIAYRVACRTREIGIRMVLGATRREVTRMVVSQAARLAALGLAAGMVLGFALARAMNALLYGVGALDPLTFTLTPLVLLAVALAAGFLPARRAARLDPAAALRHE
jgi:predicted permease